MSAVELLILIIIFFLTSVIGVVTGGNSLITVPAMLQFGVEPHVAVATNMLALTSLSAGGTLPFIGKNLIPRRRLPVLIVLTLAGSIGGALLLLVVPSKAMPLIISIFMITVAIFSVIKRDAGLVQTNAGPSRVAEISGYITTFVLGVYGGFFSGGYVTLLTAAYVTLFGMTFLEAVATTKLINIFSSLVATLIFMQRGLVDYKLGIILSISMFIGAVIGARVTLKLSNMWIRRIFISTVIALALKMLFYDFILKYL
ncbi:MAG TPA: sulfite exporter TauE/SafE family protein [Thermodesulfobacteriota bacterium]|nr:sulfite exporter TauE/SafE family protein [Thermodesulfobacteriota bacterium]